MRYAHTAGVIPCTDIGAMPRSSNMRYAHTTSVIHCANIGAMPRSSNMRYAHTADVIHCANIGAMPLCGAPVLRTHSGGRIWAGDVFANNEVTLHNAK